MITENHQAMYWVYPNLHLYLREGCRKKTPYFLWSFARGGVSEGSEKAIKLLWKRYFFREHVESF